MEDTLIDNFGLGAARARAMIAVRPTIVVGKCILTLRNVFPVE